MTTLSRRLLLCTIAALASVIGAATEAQEIPASPEVTAEIMKTVDAINDAFIRGNLPELVSYMDKGVTMLHGHERIDNLEEAENEWRDLFEKRKRGGIQYTIRTSDSKIQLYKDFSIVTFSYEHPRVLGSKISTESGKAVYIFNQIEQGRWLMAHCAVVRDFGEVGMLP